MYCIDKMTAKLFFFLVLIFFFQLSLSLESTAQKTFTRSRYSHRKSPIKSVLITNDTAVELPANSVDSLSLTAIDDDDDNNNDDTTDGFSVNLNNTDSSDTYNNNYNSDTEKTGDNIGSRVDSGNIEFRCGEKIAENHPWIVVLEHSDPAGRNRKKTLSKGVLIGPRHVLTTVSSIHNSRPFWIVTRVRLGDTPTWGGHQRRNRSAVIHVDVAEIFQHKSKDIAIIKLVDYVEFTDLIHPVCLPTTADYSAYRELELHMCKRASSMSISRVPTVTTVTVSPLSMQDCTIMFQRKRAQLSGDEFCAWDETGDTCAGDLGGPLNVKINGRYHVVGLSSFVNIMDSDFRLSDYPGVYTKVASHLKWINTILNLEE